MTTRMVRSGRSPVISATDQIIMNGGPDVWATVQRYRLYAYWSITSGEHGPVLARGRTWTRGGAWVKAGAAAHRPGVTGGAS